MKKYRNRPLIKYPGGKESELFAINPNYPKKIKRFFEPFVGGGAVFFDISNCKEIDEYYINDKSFDLYNLYQVVKSHNQEYLKFGERLFKQWRLIETILKPRVATFIELYYSYKKNGNKEALKIKLIEVIDKELDTYNQIDSPLELLETSFFSPNLKKVLLAKMTRMVKQEAKLGNLPSEDIGANIETVFKANFYYLVREAYNKNSLDNVKRAVVFFFLREFCYSSMFRFNANGEFNVPYGGMSYNYKNIELKFSNAGRSCMIELLKSTKISCLDFEDFFEKYSPEESDFIFLDPPYDTTFSSYDQNTFDRGDQSRLAETLSKTKAKFLMVINYTPFIYELYSKYNFTLETYDKNYQVSFMDRNKKDVSHLVVRNY